MVRAKRLTVAVPQSTDKQPNNNNCEGERLTIRIPARPVASNIGASHNDLPSKAVGTPQSEAPSASSSPHLTETRPLIGVTRQTLKRQLSQPEYPEAKHWKTCGQLTVLPLLMFGAHWVSFPAVTESTNETHKPEAHINSDEDDSVLAIDEQYREEHVNLEYSLHCGSSEFRGLWDVEFPSLPDSSDRRSPG